MNSLTGKSEYMDVLERSLYNGALDGLSLSGDRFFYGNPLASQGNHSRREWFGTACCPSNIARLITSVGGYIYGQEKNKIYINLFVGSESSFDLSTSTMNIKTTTAYPWQGNVSCNISMSKKEKAAIAFRIPGWLRNTPAPGGLYSFLNQSNAAPTILVNGQLVGFKEENGYAIIEKEWEDGDKVEYKMPMEVRKIVARKELVYDNERIALQRGPVVYCIEGADNGGNAWNILSPSTAKFDIENFNVLDEKVISLVSTLPVLQIGADGQSVKSVNQKVRAIPYYTWCNRGSNPMQVWLPNAYKDIKINY